MIVIIITIINIAITTTKKTLPTATAPITATAAVTRTAVVPVEQFTGQVYVRVRGRQMSIKIESSDLGVTWQLGAPRIDVRLDGRR